jgi:glycosyltransferase involved in cell wall biosynthesis
MHFPRYYSWRSRWLSWLTVWRAARLATRIIAVSEQTKQDLINKFKVAADRIVAIPNALPHLPIAAVTPVVNGDYILVVGRVEARKNPTAAIKAFALIAADYPKLQLVFAGSPGFQAEHAKQLAQALGLADRIQFLGFISPQTLADLYAYAKILLFPSFYEGFGLPVLEAFHYGVPVVASTTPAVSEVAGDAALLVEPTDTVGISRALVRLLEEPELRAELIAKGVERLKQFTWDVSAGQLRELINNLDE